METQKKIFNRRAFVAMMAGLMGLSLPFSGLGLHVHSHGIRGDGHVWLTMHVLGAVLFLIFVVWHIVLNRRAFLSHLKSKTAGTLRLSRETLTAVLITAALFIVLAVHPH